jgi:hypothetical protein
MAEADACAKTPFHEVLSELRQASGGDENRRRIHYIWTVPSDKTADLRELLVVAMGSVARHRIHLGLPWASCPDEDAMREIPYADLMPTGVGHPCSVFYRDLVPPNGTPPVSWRGTPYKSRAIGWSTQ